MGIPDHLTCLLINLSVGQEATVRTLHGSTHWFKIGKGVHQGYIFCLAYLTFMWNTSGEMPGWMTHKLESRLLGEISTSSDMQMIITLKTESEEKLKSFFMRVNEESEKAGLKLNTQKTKINASGLNTLWQVEGGKVEAVTDFLFLGSKISADGDCSHEVKR